MLTYDLEKRGTVAIYEYLYRAIREDILSGRIKAAEKLPSKRALAQNLKISVITVENAYAQLALEGYIYSRQRRGYFVNDIKTPKRLPKKIQLPAVPDKKSEVLADISTNSVTPEKFPFSVWSRLMRGVLTEYESTLLSKLPNTGIFELRAAIAEHLYRFKGMEVNPDNIIIGAGTDYLYNILLQLLGKNRIYAIENPGHKNIARIYQSNGIRFCCIGLDGEGLSVKALWKSPAVCVHISPSHHYPTGIVMSAKRRYELLDWADKNNGYIIEDDYDSEFRFAGRPVPSIYGIDTSGRVIYINTFSKTLAPSVRISYTVLPDALMEEYRRRLGFYSCSVSAFEQYTLAKFISGGYFEKHINRMKNYYKERRDRIIAYINSCAPENVTISEKDSGLHFLMQIDTHMNDDELKKLLHLCGVHAMTLSDYYEENPPSDTHTVIINYSGTAPEILFDALKKLFAAVGNVG